ncbi:MAG: GNAT family N-acetyltransferase [Chitinophagaceae bacterium]
MITIKNALITDAPLIAELSRKTFTDTFAPFNSAVNMEKFMRESFSHEQLISEVGMPLNYFLLAYSDGQPAGYVRIRENNNPPELDGRQTIEIARIYVVKEAIGKGVGRLLMEESISLGKSLQKELVWLGVWEKNDHAIAFYKKWGFTRFSQHEFILGDDIQTDWLMKRDL